MSAASRLRSAAHSLVQVTDKPGPPDILTGYCKKSSSENEEVAEAENSETYGGTCADRQVRRLERWRTGPR